MDFVRLDTIAEKYFGLKPAVARRKASKGELPIKAFRLGGPKSPLLVLQSDLDQHVVSRVQAAEELKRAIQEVHGG